MDTIKWAVNKMPKTEDSNLPIMGLTRVFPSTASRPWRSWTAWRSASA